jgi:NAD(P)-dependent dehydrogenase (short-subunit alcohol dehydrogenase family)
MAKTPKTVIVTGGSQGIGSGAVKAFLDRDYNVVASLAIEYAKDRIRVNAVAPGVVDTPLHGNNPKDFLKTLSPMGSISTVQEIVDAIVYLTEAPHVSGEVLHVDGGAHIGKW